MIRKKSLSKKTGIQSGVFNRHIKVDTPKIEGIYLCYVCREAEKEEAFPKTNMELVIMHDKTWCTKNPVLAFMGPLPQLVVDDIKSMYEPDQKYTAGTLKDVLNGINNVPLYVLDDVEEHTYPKEGLFIWKVDSGTIVAVDKSNGDEWENVSSKEAIKIAKRLSMMKKRIMQRKNKERE